MVVRFKEPYAETTNGRLSYELVADEPEKNGYYSDALVPCYNTKLLGLIPTYRMEITTDPTDIPAIDVFVKLSNT